MSPGFQHLKADTEILLSRLPLTGQEDSMQYVFPPEGALSIGKARNTIIRKSED